MNPEIIILDEPTSALDVSSQAQIMNLLKNLKKESNMSMMFIIHDIALSSDVCDKIDVLNLRERRFSSSKFFLGVRGVADKICIPSVD